ncbi:MAG: acetyl-CoA carboxylase, biotin carboxyl carrier protein [Betaproteobacteria bacterium]|nr:acetyl-CoA carboxylase, biotin carboxyl carrier protein [Betaproteobacteria bacterium]
MSELTHDDVQKILKIIDEMGNRDIHLEIGDLKLHVTRGNDPSNPGYAAAAPAPATPAHPVETAVPPPKPQEKFEVPAGQVAVSAPTIGTFFRAPSPGAQPFVEVGDRVEADTIVGVFDVMKLFTSLAAGVAGTVTAILAANEALVEQDQPLVLIKPD